MYSTSFAELLSSEGLKMKVQHQRRYKHRQSLLKQQEHELYTQIIKYSVAIFQIMVACQTITSITAQGQLYDESKFHAQSNLESESILSTQSETLDHRGTQYSSAQKLIQFEPTSLNFEEEPIGMPKMSIVYIRNPSKHKDLNLKSIYANTAHFHSSFFEKKTVPPGGNTSFEVVFLARVVGKEESTLFISTIQGTFKYKVQGVGIPNPYRLRPYIGAKVPLNTSFSPLINMHNPTNQTLQVTEMYSSSGFLQLQLPNNKHVTDKEFWEIPPYETKCLMRACFLGQVEANHTAFIRIKTNQTDFPELHILPVEVEVSSATGIYSSTDLLDFGTLRSHDEPKTLSLFLLNSGDKDVVIQSVSTININRAVTIEFRPVKLRPSKTVFTKIANVTFSAPDSKSKDNWHGNIVIKAKNKLYPRVTIPFTVDILEGTLGYDHEATIFMKNTKLSSQPIIKSIPLTSTFKTPVIVKEISLPEEVHSYFKVINFMGPFTLSENTEVLPFSLYFDPTGGIETSKLRNLRRNKKAVDKKATLDDSLNYIVLHTNASKFSLPLYTYSGNLKFKVLREESDRLDFGIMTISDSRQILLALYNYNPVSVNVTSINSTTELLSIQMVSLTQGPTNLTVVDSANNFQLPTNSCAVFEVTLKTSTIEQEIISALNIYTKYQVLQVPVIAQVVIGALLLKPAKAKLPPSFPGLIVHQSITVTNTFAQMTKLESVTPRTEDKRFYFKKIKNKVLDLESNQKTKVGKIYFDARQSCKPDKCYVGLPTSTTIGHHWLTTLTLSQEAVELDIKLYNQLKERWNTVTQQDERRPNTSMVLATNVALSVDIPVQAELIWPTLLEEESFQFPLTHIGRNSVAVLTLNNPADSPVIVQVLPLSYYPQPDAILDLLDWSQMKETDGLVTKNHSVFKIISPLNEKDTSMVWLEYTLNGKLNRSAVNLFLHPNQRVTVKIEFTPFDDKPKSTVIVLRNNLTVVDALVVRGTGAREFMKLGKEIPNNPNNMLKIDLTESILKDCKDPTISSPNFTVRKSFTAKNMGLLPIVVTSIMFDNLQCEGYGFKITDCDQFILQPNATKTIHVVFTPDFTSSQIVHKLRIITGQGNEMAFNLKATVPPHMLSICQDAIPRPNWEPTLSAVISAIMIILFGAGILNAYLEAINLWEPFVKNYEERLRISAQNQNALTDLNKPFDLREIATNYISTVASPPVERNGRRYVENERNVIHRNNPPEQLSLQNIFQNVRNFAHSKYLFISSIFSKPKRRRPFKKPIELIDPNLLKKQNEILESKSHTVMASSNSFSKRKLSKELSSGDKNTSQMMLRRRNTAAVYSETHSNNNKKNSQKSKHNNYVGNEANHNTAVQSVAPPQTPPFIPEASQVDTFDPVMIAKMSAQARGRNSKRESSSSCTSAESSESTSGRKKKEDSIRKKQKSKNHRKDTFNNSKGDDNSSTTTEKSSEDFEQFHDTSKTFELEDKPKPVTIKKETDKPFTRNPRRNSSNQLEKKNNVTPKTLPIASRNFRQKENKLYGSPKSRQYRKLNSDPNFSYIQRTSSKSSSASGSSTEDSPNWEIPSYSPGFAQDPDEGMKLLSAQSFKAENDIQKEREKNTSPNKTNLSRHSSYSSIVSSSSSTDSNNARQKNNPSPAKDDVIKEKKSKPRHQQPKGHFTHKSKSKTHDNLYPTHGTSFTSRQMPPQQTSFSSYFSPSNQLNQKKDKGAVREPIQRTQYHPAQDWNAQYATPSASTSYTAFGQSSFDIAGSLLPTSNNQSMDWNNSFSPNTSLYTTPPPSTERSRKPFPPLVQDQSSGWSGFNSQLSLSSSGQISPTSNFSELCATSNNVLSTHSIWSVSNAVTMDENRAADETIPAGLKSIWANGSNKGNGNNGWINQN